MEKYVLKRWCNEMKVIFLDIDGVLNSAEQNTRLIDDTKLELLKTLVDRTNAKIVLHSGWRLMFDREGKPQKPKAEYLLEKLESVNLRLYEFTEDMSKVVNSKSFTKLKEKAILDWVGKHEVDKWVVLDDIVFVNDEIKHHAIHVNGMQGLTRWNVKLAIKLLS